MDFKEKVKNLIEYAYREQASDIHLAEDREPVVRVYGTLVKVPNQPFLTKEEVTQMLSILVGDKEKVDEFMHVKEIDFAYEHEEQIRLRGNAYFREGAISIALRIIPKVKSLAELNLPEDLLQFTRQRQGFFLIVGPIGQGKTTTMAAMIDAINQERTEHIVTIEHPIEYVFEEKNSIIDQREVLLDTSDFHTALKSVFRQDANVIMIGEMRDPETIRAAVTAAETGHLVLSTVHTNTAAQTIDRIIDSFPAEQQDQIRTQLSSSLTGIFSQRLVPTNSGGLVPAYELLINNNAIANLIRENRTHEIPMVIETGSEYGMIDMNQRLADLVRQGAISVENARSAALNERIFNRLV